jgi:Xaa-Pro aminopeptidase
VKVTPLAPGSAKLIIPGVTLDPSVSSGPGSAPAPAPGFGPGSAFAARRLALAARLAGRPALIAAGGARPRNYLANTYPYRAGSHFLYLFGLAERDALALFDGQDWILHLAPRAADDALWEGPRPSFEEITEITGCAVRSLADIEASLRHPATTGVVATLPAPDLETCGAQSRLLGRAVKPGVLDAADEALADAMIALRLRHDPAAIAELRLAAVATDAAHRAGMRATRAGQRESTVRAAMEAEITARDLTVAYGSIVTTHGEVLHNEQHHRALAPHDMILADVGAESPGGFAGDVTRTWPVSGRFSTPQRDLYQVVLNAQKQAIAAVAPGVRYRDIHLRASRALAAGLVDVGLLRGDPAELCADGVLALLFPHGVGHLLGLDVHDMEDLGDRAGYAPGRQRGTAPGMRYLRLDRDLTAGMALTIEPGIYFIPAVLDDPTLDARIGGRLDRARLTQFLEAGARGIRIEDDVLVTDQGHDVLSAAVPKEIAEVETAMAG